MSTSDAVRTEAKSRGPVPECLVRHRPETEEIVGDPRVRRRQSRQIAQSLDGQARFREGSLRDRKSAGRKHRRSLGGPQKTGKSDRAKVVELAPCARRGIAVTAYPVGRH